MTIVAFLDYFVLAVHVIVCVLLIGIVLIQGGKGASLSASFGMGAAATAFGARTDSFMTKLTGGAAVLFVFTSVGLTLLASRTGSITQTVTIPQQAVAPATQQIEATPDTSPEATETPTAP